MNNTAIRQYVQELIEKHNTCSPFQLAELCGIQLVYAPIKSLRGYYIKSSRIKIIVISTEADDAHLGYICAHELCHALLHDKINMHYLTTKSYFPAGIYERKLTYLPRSCFWPGAWKQAAITRIFPYTTSCAAMAFRKKLLKH